MKKTPEVKKGETTAVVKTEIKIDAKIDVTQKANIRKSYDTMNKSLFGGKLPDCIITFAVSKQKAYGVFKPYSYRLKSDKNIIMPEIFINASYFERVDSEIHSTLLHEMVHLLQHIGGTLGKNGYHGKDFATKMLKVGLIASSDGTETGKKSGLNMSHYTEDGKKFDKLYKSKLKDFPILFHALTVKPLKKKDIEGVKLVTGTEDDLLDEQDRKKKRADGKKKVTYKCSCSTIYGKGGLRVKCLDCDGVFKPYDKEEEIKKETKIKK